MLVTLNPDLEQFWAKLYQIILHYNSNSHYHTVASFLTFTLTYFFCSINLFFVFFMENGADFSVFIHSTNTDNRRLNTSFF